MPLETFTDPERLNIKNLKSPERERQAHFDIKRDIPKNIVELLLHDPGRSTSEIAHRYFDAYQIDPELASRMKPDPLTTDVLEFDKDALARQNKWENTVWQLESLSVLSPKKASLYPTQQQRFVAIADACRAGKEWLHYFNLSRIAWSIDLGMKPLNEEEVVAALAWLDGKRSISMWSTFGEGVFGLCATNPAEVSFITEEDWLRMSNSLQRLWSEKRCTLALSLASVLAQLSRLEELHKPQLSETEIPPLPTQRQF